MSTAIIKPQWSPLSIALMVLGFIVFWPLGLAMLGYILWGENFGGSAEKAQDYWNKGVAMMGHKKAKAETYAAGATSSGNAAFDAYREDQLRRLEDERRRLDDEIVAFKSHVETLRRARDREEFDRFMSERNDTRTGTRPETRQGYGDQVVDVRPNAPGQSS